MFTLLLDNQTEEKLEIFLSGEVDIASAPDFKTKLYDLIGDGKKISYYSVTALSILTVQGLVSW